MSSNPNANVLRRLCLCLAVTLASWGAATAQNPVINLSGAGNGRSVSVSQVIETIESQTGFQISYNKNTLDPARRIILSATALPLDRLLASLVQGVAVRPVVQGRYIAFVPSADNSRPQVRQPQVPLTGDSYNPNDPNALSAAPRPRPQEEFAAPTLVVTAARELAKPFHSDFRPLESYNVIQNGRPRFALKTNLLYGAAALTPNLAAEIALAPRSTLEISYSNNPFHYAAELPSNKKLLHGIAGAEYRYWLCERFGGHFFGVNALYSEYNVSGHDIPTLFDKAYRYHGKAYGGGLTYGYALPVAKRWNVEFTAGVGVLRMEYDRYSCLTCDKNAVPTTKTWFGPMNLGVNLVFLIK